MTKELLRRFLPLMDAFFRHGEGNEFRWVGLKWFAEALGEADNERVIDALRIMLEDCPDSGVAGTALVALAQVVERNAARVATKALHMLARIDDLVKMESHPWSSLGPEEHCQGLGITRVRLDCSSLRYLVQQELTRRAASSEEVAEGSGFEAGGSSEPEMRD